MGLPLERWDPDLWGRQAPPSRLLRGVEAQRSVAWWDAPPSIPRSPVLGGWVKNRKAIPKKRATPRHTKTGVARLGKMIFEGTPEYARIMTASLTQTPDPAWVVEAEADAQRALVGKFLAWATVAARHTVAPSEVALLELVVKDWPGDPSVSIRRNQ